MKGSEILGNFSLQNIVEADGISISITGMLIVFSGLLLLSLYIKWLPRVLEILGRKTKYNKRKEILSEKDTESPGQKENELAAQKAAELEKTNIASVIGFVLHLEMQRYMGNGAEDEQITIARGEVPPSMWRAVGKMRQMPHRRTHA